MGVITNSLDYYNDESRYGEYQYVTLNEVINNFMMSRDTDDHHSTVTRNKVLFQAMRGMRELYYDIVREVRAISLEISPTLSVTLPPDFVNYVRISWVDAEGNLYPMAVDDKMDISRAYLQDHEYKLLFDHEGCVLQGDRHRPDVGESSSTNQDINYSHYSFCQQSFQPNRDLSRHFPNGKYRVDKSRGVIQFSSDVFGKEIVLEYISDGVYTGCEGRPEDQIRVHKFAEAALMDFIYYELIKNRNKVPANEKFRARKEYYNSRRIAKRRINTVRIDEVLQVFKGSTRWNEL